MKTDHKNDRELAHQRDLDLLYKMYKHRALSTAQIAHIRRLGKWYVYEKLNQLRREGYIYTENIRGNYIPSQSRQGKYHRLSGKGITLLREHDYSVSGTTDDLKLGKYRLPYLLVSNDLVFSLKESGWIFKEGRKVKRVYELNRNDHFQGTLTNPDNNKEYVLYVFLKKVRSDTLARIRREIIRNPFENILICTRGNDSFRAIIEAFYGKKKKLIKGGSIKVLPFGFARSYLNISSDNEKVHRRFLEELGIKILPNSEFTENNTSNVKFDYLVEHNNEQKYFVDLLDNDLMKMLNILSYRKEEYERDGRKILALTSASNFHISLHRQLLEGIHHIEYLGVNASAVTKLSKKYMSESQVKEGD